MSGTVDRMMEICASQIGYCRWDDPAPGSRYGRWFHEALGYDPGYISAAYCAMGASWALAEAGVKCSGMPSPYCPAIEATAAAAGRCVGRGDARRGDLILFDWDGDREADHIGIVKDPHEGYVDTIEFNTTGPDGRSGSVARRRRAWTSVTHLVRPDYADDGADRLLVDGWWGSATTRRLQEVLGTVVDGEVWGQWPYNSQPACTTGWRYDWSMSGSAVIHALQTRIGVDRRDGLLGAGTIRQLQAYLGTPVDGRLDGPSRCVMALQERLNAGTL